MSEPAPAAAASKPCPRCKEDKPLAAYYRDRSRPDGYGRCCKLCQDLANKARFEAGPPPDPRHRSGPRGGARRAAILAELERNPHRTDVEIARAAGAGSLNFVGTVRAERDFELMLRNSARLVAPPTPRTMRAIACATEAELRLFHPSYVAKARELGIIR